MWIYIIYRLYIYISKPWVHFTVCVLPFGGLYSEADEYGECCAVCFHSII